MTQLRPDANAAEPVVDRGAVRDTDLELLERWRVNDLSAARSLLERHNDALVKLLHTAVANDVERRTLVHETFRRLTASHEPLRRDASVRTHLFQIARLVLIEHLSRAPTGSARTFDPRVHSLASVSEAAPAHLIASLAPIAPLLDRLHALPLDDKLLLELRHWHGCSHGELGKILGLSQEAVKQRLVDAEAALRKGLVQPDASEGSPYRAIEPDLRALGMQVFGG